MPDALTRARQLLGHPVADPFLEVGVTLEAELGGEADDGRAGCADPLGEVRDRPEGQESGLGEDGLGDAALRRGETLTRGCDEIGDGHG